MHRTACTIALFAVALAATPALACGEGQFNLGQGMRFQGYLAPRPATVLIYDQNPRQRDAIYLGLNRAGHRVTVARDVDTLSRALRDARYDLMIVDLAESGAVDAASGLRLLPVIQRQQRNDTGLRSRFRVFLLEGASLGQYLKGIDHLVRGAAQ